MHGDACVGSLRPELPSLRVQDVRFGAIEPDIRQRQLDGPLAGRLLLQRNIAPEGDGEWIFPRVRGDDFLAQAVRFAQVGAQQRPPALAKTLRRAKTKTNAITDKTQQAFAGRRSHNQFIHATCRVVLSLNSQANSMRFAQRQSTEGHRKIRRRLKDLLRMACVTVAAGGSSRIGRRRGTSRRRWSSGRLAESRLWPRCAVWTPVGRKVR